jgi:hypothetical protein
MSFSGAYSFVFAAVDLTGKALLGGVRKKGDEGRSVEMMLNGDEEATLSRFSSFIGAANEVTGNEEAELVRLDSVAFCRNSDGRREEKRPKRRIRYSCRTALTVDQV